MRFSVHFALENSLLVNLPKMWYNVNITAVRVCQAALSEGVF